MSAGVEDRDAEFECAWHELPWEARTIMFEHYCDEEWAIADELRRLGFNLEETDYGDQDWARHFMFSNAADVIRLIDIGGRPDDWGWSCEDRAVVVPRLGMRPLLLTLRKLPAPSAEVLPGH